MSDTNENERIKQRFIIDNMIRDFDIQKQNKLMQTIEEFKKFSRKDVLNEETIALLVFFFNKLSDNA